MFGCCFLYGIFYSVFSDKYIFGGFFFGLCVLVGERFVLFGFVIDIVGSGWVLVVFNGIVGFKFIKGIVFVCGFVLVCCMFDIIIVVVFFIIEVCKVW